MKHSASVYILKDKKMTKKERKELDAMFDFTRLGESRMAQEMGEEGATSPTDYPPIRYLHLKNPLVGWGIRCDGFCTG